MKAGAKLPISQIDCGGPVQPKKIRYSEYAKYAFGGKSRTASQAPDVPPEA